MSKHDAYYKHYFQDVIDRMLDFKQLKQLPNEYEAGLYQDVVLDRLSRLGFKKSNVRFKVSPVRFLWIFETSKRTVYTELLTDDIITAMKIIE